MLKLFQVKHERVIRREEPSKDSKMMGYELKGKVVAGEQISHGGVSWLKSKFRGAAGQASTTYMMIDGSSVGLGMLLEPWTKPEPWKVVGERVAQRAEASTSSKLLGQVTKGKIVYGSSVHIGGAEFLKGEKDGEDCFMLVDGTSLGLGRLLKKEVVIDPFANEGEATATQLKLSEAASSLAEALKEVPLELEMEGRPKVRLMLSLEVLGACLHDVMDMDFAGRTRSIEDGMKAAKAGLKIAKETGDSLGEAEAMDVIAVAYLMKGQADHAAKVATEVQGMFRKAQNKNGQARALTTLANCSCAKASRVMGGNKADAMKNVHPDKLEEFKKLQAEQLEDASRHAEDALFLVKGRDPRLEVKATLKTAVVDQAAGKAERAKDSCDEAAKIARKMKLPDLEKDCSDLAADCIDVHMKRGEFADAADVASEIGAIYKEKGDLKKADQLIRKQIAAHVEGQEGQWALAAAKNDLVRLWRGKNVLQEATALHEVAKIHLALREAPNVVKAGREAMALLSDKDTMLKVKILRSMMQAHMVEEDKRDLSAAGKIAKECQELAQSAVDGKIGEKAEAFGRLWQGRVDAEKFFNNYIPKITAWKNPTYTGKRNEKDLKLKDYEKAMKLIDQAYLTFEKGEDEAGMQEAFEAAYAVQQKTNSTQDPAKTTHIFKNGQYDHSEYSYDYAAVAMEQEEKERNEQAALVE